MNRECKHCGVDFDASSFRKRDVGGRINECADCVEELGTETAPATIGVMSGEGKIGVVTVLRFDDPKNAKAYMKAWRHSTGHNSGGGTPMGSTTTLSMDRLGAKKVAEFGGNPNHKGHS